MGVATSFRHPRIASLKVCMNYAAFRAIRWLNLHDTQISDASLPLLMQRTDLLLLDLNDTNVSEGGVEQLKAALPDCSVRW